MARSLVPSIIATMTVTRRFAPDPHKKDGSCCRICASLGLPVIERPLADRPLFAAEGFEVWLSLGAFIEGWLLLIPKDHQLNIARLPARSMPQLVELCERVQVAVERLYGPVVMFEHGPAQTETLVGCGVDHAHLHMVPFAGSLRQAIDLVISTTLTWSELSGLPALLSSGIEEPYVYIDDADGVFVATGARIGSQLVRRALANSVGCPGQYDWARFPHLDKVRDAADSLGASQLAVS
jgi:ATP adenylyltransferase